MTTRVVLAEDNALLREGLSQLVESRPGLELIGIATDLPSLMALIERDQPDVVVTDIRMPPTGTDEGIRAASELRQSHPDVGVVVLSQYAETAYAIRLFEDGASRRAYLLKDRVADADELMRAITTVADGGSVVDASIVQSLVAATTQQKTNAFDRLTVREREILAEMARGGSNAGIAASLHVSERAVEKHSSSIFAKLGLYEERTVNRRVKAVLVYLSEHAGA